MGNGRQGHSDMTTPNQVLELIRKVNEAQSKSVDNEKRIIELEKTVNDKSQWNTTVRGWMGTRVSVRLLTGQRVIGILRALDRYTLMVEGMHLNQGTDVPTSVPDDTIIIHKGAITTICRIL